MTAEDRDEVRVALRVAGARFIAARVELDAGRGELQPILVKALRAGLAQKEIVELSGYTRESIRTLARAHGIGSGTTTPGAS